MPPISAQTPVWRAVLSGFAVLVVLILRAPPLAVAADETTPVPSTRSARWLDPTHICDEAVTAAEARFGIPKNLLKAIGGVESGRMLPSAKRARMWPWTVNTQGQSLFFGTRDQAADWVRQQQSAGVRSIDLGCMQINLLHHPKAFRSIEDALDPWKNAAYAAQFLLRLRRMAGDWGTAVGYYHSQVSASAEAYRSRVRIVYDANNRPRLTALQLAWQATLPHADLDWSIAVGEWRRVGSVAPGDCIWSRGAAHRWKSGCKDALVLDRQQDPRR